MNKLRRNLLVTAVVGVILCYAASYYAPIVLLGNLTEVPSDFLTGLLTFDGIMVAVFALSFSSSSADKDSDPRWISTLMSAPFLISAMLALYSLLRLHVGTLGELASSVDTANRQAIGLSALGTTLWFYVMMLIRYFDLDDSTTPSEAEVKTTL